MPRHIAVIMDGNGRWARQKGLERIQGHQKGTEATVNLVDNCIELGVECLTLYVFSFENWNRPEGEVKFLIEHLLIHMMDQEIDHLMEKGVRLQVLGDQSRLPESSRKKLEEGIAQTSGNSNMVLNLAISYGGRREIVQAAQKFATDVEQGKHTPQDLNEELFGQYLYAPELPYPELMIRTGGEKRISNYLLWQLAYSEFYFSDLLWPDFDKVELEKAIDFFQGRERRFGRVLNE